MKNFVYPALFVKNDDDKGYSVLFPDLQISTDGSFVEEAFLYAKEALKAYFIFATKYDIDYNLPTEYSEVAKVQRPGQLLMLVDAEITKKDLL